jgi:hypothetical protein
VSTGVGGQLNLRVDRKIARMDIGTVAVVGGTGRQGGGLAKRFARAGVDVIVGSRDPARADATIASWPAPARTVRTASYADAIGGASIVVLAVPFESIGDLLAAHTNFRAGAIVVDVAVPVTFGESGPVLAQVDEGSAAEHVKARVPQYVRVAGAFKTLPARLLDDVDRPLDCDEFVCGDSSEAREAAQALVRLLQGLRPIDVGPLARARAIEHLTLLAIAINRRHKVHDARYRVVGLT